MAPWALSLVTSPKFGKVFTGTLKNKEQIQLCWMPGVLRFNPHDSLFLSLGIQVRPTNSKCRTGKGPGGAWEFFHI